MLITALNVRSCNITYPENNKYKGINLSNFIKRKIFEHSLNMPIFKHKDEQTYTPTFTTEQMKSFTDQQQRNLE
jgi:hypothetical protein